jgi:hypothetical protein
MATNIVSQVLELLTPELIGRIAAMLGIDRAKAQSAVATAVPALLATMRATAAQPQGAKALAEAARREGPALGDVQGLIAAGDGASLIDRGSRLVSSVLGGQDEGAIARAVGGAVGIDEGTGRSLLAMLAPVVLGGVARQAGGDLGAGNIAALLASQKDNIAAALPAGLAGALPDAVRGIGGTAKRAGQGAATAVHAVADAGGSAAAGAAATTRNWLYWLVPAAAVLALFAYFLWPAERAVEEATTAATDAVEEATTAATTAGEEVATTATDAVEETATAATDAAQSVVVEGVDLGQTVTDGIGTLTTALTGVTDEASARTALAKVEEVGAEVDKVAGHVGALTADQKKVVAGLVDQALPDLSLLIDKVLAIPGVAAVLGPPLESLKTKLTTLAA